MTREFYHYSEWEDYKGGMFRNVEKEEVLDYADKARRILTQPDTLRQAMQRVVKEWLVSTAHNLTNNEANSKAWLGQAACCIAEQVPEDLTRMAWNTLSSTEMKVANNIAEQVIQEWIIARKRKNGIQKDLFRN